MNKLILVSFLSAMKFFETRFLSAAIAVVIIVFKFNESRYKQCGVTPHFPTRQNILKKILRKDKYRQRLLNKILRKVKYCHNQLRKAF